MLHRFTLLLGLALGALLLAACGPAAATTWPGVSADSQYVYIAQGQQMHAVNLADGRQVWSFPSVRSNDDHEAKFPLELPRRVIRLPDRFSN